MNDDNNKSCNKSCWWCWWHSWDSDTCLQTGAVICGNSSDHICKKYTTAEQWDKEHAPKWI